MRRHPAIVFALGALLASATPVPAASPEGFEVDPRKAFDRARQSGSPLLLEFHTTWCSACEEMRETTWPAAAVRERLHGFVALSVDGERNRILQERYAVEAYPTIVVAEPSGKLVLVLLGFQSAGDLAQHLDAVTGAWERLAALARRADGGAGESAATLELAEFAASRHADTGAERMFRRALARKQALTADERVRARHGLARVLAAGGRCRDALRTLGDDDGAEDVRRDCAAMR